MDHSFYNPTAPILSVLTTTPPPLRSLLYNLSPTNLATHGLHPRYTHLLVNLPMLLGPAVPVLFAPPYSTHFYTALAAIVLLSIMPHQEARFLVPTIPLMLASIRLPSSRKGTNVFIGTWIFFNIVLGTIFGIFHQGGVVPMQIWLGAHHQYHQLTQPPLSQTPVLWWRTYSPPVWLLDGKDNSSSLQTVDLMSMPANQFLQTLEQKTACGSGVQDLIVVAPRSSRELDAYRAGEKENWHWEELWTEWRHLNLDDMDWGEDGVVDTLQRVFGRRGLTAWSVKRDCN